MMRQASYRRALALTLMCVWLTGCAAIGELTVQADSAEARLVRCLDRDDWRLDRNWSAEDRPASFRWRFGEQPDRVVTSDRRPERPSWESLQTLLDELSREPTTEVDALLRALSRKRGRIGRNAAIVLARHDPAAANAGALLEIVTSEVAARDGRGLLQRRLSLASEPLGDDEAIPVSTRAAAAEAWCRVIADRQEAAIEERLAIAGNLWRDETLPESVRAELLRGLARHLPPERIVGYDALSPANGSAVSTELQRAAIDGCLLFVAHHPTEEFDPSDWPAAIENAAFNPDPEIRRGYGRWLALSRHPEAAARLADQLRDTETNVWKSAVDALALVATDEARETLRKVAAKPSELQRAAAVSALATWGSKEIEPYLSDESPHVRRAATSALAGSPGPAAVILLDQALTDSDLDTQHRAIAATYNWDHEFALPVLLAGLRNAAVKTRRECLDELRRRTGFEDSFPVTADAPERAASLASLSKKHGWPLDAMTRFRLASSAEKGPKPVSSDVATLLAEMLQPTVTAERRQELCNFLHELGPEIVPAVEAVCLAETGPGVESLLVDVLPALHPAHAALRELQSEDVALRRQAAGRLAELGRGATLSPLVLRRLSEILPKEQDGLVWRQSMAAITADATPGAEQIVLLAINNAWPDVRRLGCEYVGRHRRPHQARWLMPLLADSNGAVRLAAIDAVGLCGNASIIEERPGGGTASGLRAAAVDSSRVVRLAALVSLSRLGDEAGSVALLRWAEFEPTSERIKAVRAIAATGRRRFEPDLARLAWTEKDDVVRRELLSALESLVPTDQRPAGADAPRAEDRIAAWASRWEGTRTSSTMPPR